jgi:protein phosphatase PTC7
MIFCSTDDSSEEDFDCQPEFISNGFVISKEPRKKSEDAIFVGPRALGVADGVGGWANFGIDSSKFSTELMKNWSKEVDAILLSRRNISSKSQKIEMKHLYSLSNPNDECTQADNPNNNGISLMNHRTDSDSLNPKELLKVAYERTKSIGSSTACVCTLEENSLRVANLGDSGFAFLRFDPTIGAYVLIEKSKDQQHSFNAPYQLANLPGKLCGGRKRASFCKDKPEDSDLYNINIKYDFFLYPDLILLGSDGLFDNVYIKEILRIVNKYCFKIKPKINDSMVSVSNQPFDKTDALELAKRLAAKAYQASISDEWISPFGEKYNELLQKDSTFSSKLNDEEWKGGKQDDISVVVGFIC